MTKTEERMLRDLHAKGVSAREVAIQLGWTEGRVVGRWWRMGLRRRRPSLSPKEIEELRDGLTRYDRYRPNRHGDRQRPIKRPPKRPPMQAEARFVNPEDRRAGR